MEVLGCLKSVRISIKISTEAETLRHRLFRRAVTAATQVQGVANELPLGSRLHPMNINDQHCDIVFLPRLGSITRPCEHFV